MNDRLARTQSSMLWAAWADALGFISELTTAEHLVRRTKGRPLNQTMEWSRRIGGRTGVQATLPAGCYSDDTQLRLATARAIGPRGFDIEAFSRVELTVWPNYALGGGRASRAAAAGMTRRNANWANNFFKGWENSGGNGAAMRIQPHIYAARDLETLSYIEDLVANAVVTHGHPRGIVGAVFHGVCLAYTLNRGEVPTPKQWQLLLDVTRAALSVFQWRPELQVYWLPQWERKAEMSFEQAWHETVNELEQCLEAGIRDWEELRSASEDFDRARETYWRMVRVLGLHKEDSRGSAILTSVAALLLASALPDHPAQSAELAASQINTDTDTIATMAAALVGAAAPRKIQSPLMDMKYLTKEAARLHAISEGQSVETFPYPDLLTWDPPKSAVDAVGVVDGQLALAGLSLLMPLEGVYRNAENYWLWARTEFGQSLLVKLRYEPRELSPENYPQRVSSAPFQEPSTKSLKPQEAESGYHQPTLFDDDQLRGSGDTVELALSGLESLEYEDAAVGKILRSLAVHGNRKEFQQVADEIYRYFRVR